MAETTVPQAHSESRAPIHLWIVGVLALLWNLFGAMDYLATQLEWEAYMSQYSAEQLEYGYGFPAWMVSFWALGVWGAVAGSIGLLLRRSWAVWAFVLSILGLAVTTYYSYVLSNGWEVMGWFGAIFTVVIWAFTLFLLGYSRKMSQAGVLR